MTLRTFEEIVEDAHHEFAVKKVRVETFRSRKRRDSGHDYAKPCKKCLRFGRSYAIVRRHGRGRAGSFKFPKSWPTVQTGKYLLQYCPGVEHIK